MLRTPIAVGRAIIWAQAQRPSKIGLIAGSKRETCPRAIRRPDQVRRSTQDLSETRGQDSKMPGSQSSQEGIDPEQSLPGSQPASLSKEKAKGVNNQVARIPYIDG